MKELLQHRAYQIVVFNALATGGSLTQAAEMLKVSVSHVSKQLHSLEEDLGVQLINRSTRTRTLTEEGKHYAEYCAQIVSLIQEADTLVTDTRDEMSGHIRLGLSRSFATLHIIPALDKLQKKYPQLTIDVSLFDHKVDMLAEEIDLWVTTYEDISEGYVAQRIADTRFLLLASPEYLELHGTPQHPDELTQYNCVTYHSKSRSCNHWSFAKGDEEFSISVSGNYRVNLAEAVRDALIAGKGIGYLASYLLTDELETGKLVQLLPDWRANQKMPAYAVYPRNKHLPARVRTTIQFLKDTIGHPPYWDKALAKWVKF